MRSRRCHAPILFILAIGGALPASSADAEPKVLDEVATVVDAFEHEAGAGLNPLTHSHKGFEDWPIAPGSTFEVNRRLLNREAHFFDVPWSFTNEMQKPDLHVVNADKNPLSRDNFGTEEEFKSAQLKMSGDYDKSNSDSPIPIIKDFIFLFAIHNLENSDGSKTPHALIYIPYRKDDDIPKELADFYRMYIVHIPQEECACAAMEWPLARKFCEAMRRLSSKWSSGYYTEKGLTEEVRRESRELLDQIFDEQLHGDSKRVSSDPIGEFIEILFGMKLHNGIIHGTLGGG